MSSTQIYSATYSNVPVFEFVTSEGPIMRRKSDSWINATHILKIAKFPKAKRTRILEKDVQTGIHEKVQGGYGKYQGTYVPLSLGADIARRMGVYDVLQPIFEFEYVEGKSETPPPAPKHNHASALNIAKRQASAHSLPVPARKTKSMNSITGEPPKKRGRPKRVVLDTVEPKLKHSDTTPIEPGPNIGTFNNKGSFSHSPSAHPPASLLRQDTEQDALQVMTSNMNLKNEDLELVQSDDDDDNVGGLIRKGNGLNNHHLSVRLDSHGGEELMNSKELFGTPRESFEKIIQSRNNHIHNQHHLNGHGSQNSSHDPYSLSQYHQPSINKAPNDSLYSDYFSNLLTYFLDDTKIRSPKMPDRIAIPPQPIAKVNINQAIDNDGNTLFHWACSMANISMIEFLMNTFEISPEVRNNHGETPLMFLIKFNNSFQLKNFPTILQLLLESILSVDNSGKTVLHHIAANDSDKKNKERFSRYYMETLFDKLIEASDEENEEEEKGSTSPSKRDLIAKFTNHQDADGNTAFHIAAYNLNKNCIKVFISYHKYIDFNLRNLVSYTVEEYLASHNFVLRLGHEEDPNEANDGLANEVLLNHEPSSTQSFESELYNSKMAVNLQNTTSNLITEKLTELAYTIDKELSEKDETILTLFKVLKLFNQGKLQSQKQVLTFFKLEYLIEDLEKALTESNPHDLVIDSNKDKIIQEEIFRLINDLSYSYLSKRNELDIESKKYRDVQEEVLLGELQRTVEEESKISNNEVYGDEFESAVELTKEIIKRRTLVQQLYSKQSEVAPMISTNSEQKLKIEDNQNNLTGKPAVVSKYPSDDRLQKYCKLISLCCGMNVNDVESSIDLIEQSLIKSTKQ